MINFDLSTYDQRFQINSKRILHRSIYEQRAQILSGHSSYPARLNLLSNDDWLDYCAVSGADPSRLHIPVADVSQTSKSTPCSPSNNRKHITFSRPVSPVENSITEEQGLITKEKISKMSPKVSRSHHHIYSRPESPLDHVKTEGCLITSKISESQLSSPSVIRKHIPIYTRPPSPIEPIRTAGGAMTAVGKELFPPLGASKSHPSSPSIKKKHNLFSTCPPSPVEPVNTAGCAMTLTTVGKELFPPFGAPKFTDPPLTPPVTPKKLKSKEVASVREKERLLLKEIEYHRWEMEDLLKRAEDAKRRKLFLAGAYYGQLADLHFQAIENAGEKGDANNNFCPADR